MASLRVTAMTMLGLVLKDIKPRESHPGVQGDRGQYLGKDDLSQSFKQVRRFQQNQSVLEAGVMPMEGLETAFVCGSEAC